MIALRHKESKTARADAVLVVQVRELERTLAKDCRNSYQPSSSNDFEGVKLAWIEHR